MTAQTYRFKLGAFDCIVIQDTASTAPANALYSTLPEDELRHGLQEQGLSAGDLPRSMNILYIDTGTSRLLVDTGLGPIRPDAGQLLESLSALAILPERIDRIIITHGHPDHIGGIVGNDGKLNYPNARYTIWDTEWAYWLDAAERAHTPDEFARRNLPPIRDRVDHESEILPGISLIHTPGHTIGHAAVLLDSGGERLLHVADAIHHPLNVSYPHWVPRFDMQPEVAIQTRRDLLNRAVRDRLLVMAYHFPFPGLGRIVRQNATFGWSPLPVD